MALTDKIEYFECDCHSPDHMIKFTIQYDPDEKPVFPPSFFTEVQLRQWRGIFKRIIVAVKYIFGYECRYGHWDCFTTESVDDVRRLIKVCNQYLELYKDYTEKELNGK